MPRRSDHTSTKLPETVIDQPALFAECLDHLRKFPVLAFDTEFVGEHTYRPDLCLVQVATPERLFLLDPMKLDSLDPFWELLLDPGRVSVMHAGREEIRACRFAVGKPPANVFDLQIAAALLGMTYPIGYGGLVQDVLGQRIHKGETLTDWRKRPLTSAQIRYAYDDVRFLLPICSRFHDKLRKLDRMAWASEEFAAFVRRSLAEDPSIERWRKVKGLGSLGRRELAVAKALFEWREDFAERVNRPARTLLRDDLLVEIAKRSGRMTEELNGLRGVPRSEVPAIQKAIQSATSLTLEECPTPFDRENDAGHVATLAALLGVVLVEFCATLQVAPNLVATVADLKALIRSRQPGNSGMNDCSLSSGWRREHIRPHLEAVLDGQKVIRIIDPASANPIAIQDAKSKSR
jgi:ribonuclease D